MEHSDIQSRDALSKDALSKAECLRGSKVRKEDFLATVHEVFGEWPLVTENKNYVGPYLDTPMAKYRIDDTGNIGRWPECPFVLHPVCWYGIDDEIGYVTVLGQLFGNGGRVDDLKDVLGELLNTGFRPWQQP